MNYRCWAIVWSLALVLFYSDTGSSEKQCRNVYVRSSVAIKCYSSLSRQNFTNGPAVKWKTKIDTDQQEDEDWKVLQSNETRIRDCHNSNHKDCREDNVLSVLYLRNFTRKGVVIYSCFTEEGVEIDGVRLATECPLPVALSDHGCLYHVMIEKFRCCWVWTAADTPLPEHTHFNMRSIDAHNHDVTGPGYCNVSDKICCDSMFKNPFIKHYVSLRTIIGNETKNSANGTVVPFSNIKASKPTITKAIPTKNQEDIGIYVEWEEPDDYVHLINYDFRIRYRKDDIDSNWKKEDVIPNAKSFAIDDDQLQPNTVYAVQVKARANGILAGGVWSEWSKSKFVRTNLTAPEKTLKFVTPLVTMSMLSNGTIHNTVKLIWSKYDNTMEEGFFTEVSCTQPIKQFLDIKDETSVIVHTTSDVINCSGKFCNKEGCSVESKANYVIATERDYFPKSALKISVNRSVLQFALQTISSGGDYMSRMRICSRSRSRNSDLGKTLDLQSQCLVNGFVSDDVAALNPYSNTQVLINGNWSPCRQYIVITESYTRNNFVWKSAPSDIVQYDPEIQQDVDFSLVDSTTSTKAKIFVTWSKIPSHDFMSRQLRYKSVGGAECDDDHKQTCNSTFFRNIGPRNSTNATLVNHIFGSTEYEVEEWLVCPTLSSERHSQLPYVVQVPIDGKVIQTAVTKPGKPRELSISPLNSPNPVLSWTPPLHKNGFPAYEIVKYVRNGEVLRSVSDQNQETVDISCDQHNDTFTFAVIAINEGDDGILASDQATSEDVACIMSAGTSESPNIVVTIVLVIIITSVVICLTILYFCRKTIKKRLKNRFSSPAPRIDRSITEYDGAKYKTEQYQSEFPNFEARGINGNEIPDAVEICEDEVRTESELPTTSSQGQGILLNLTVNDDANLSEYVAEQSVDISDGNFRRRTISTASTVPASTSCDNGIRQYVKIAECPFEESCHEHAATHNTTTFSGSEYLPDVNLSTDSAVVYTDVDVQQTVQAPSSYVDEVPGEECDGFLGNDPTVSFHNEYCRNDDLPYTVHCSQPSRLRPQVSVKSHNAARFSYKRQSSSSSGIIADFNGTEDSLQEETTNYLTNCVPNVISSVPDVDVDSVEAGRLYRNYEMDDIENVSSDDDASQEAYVDLESVTLLSNNV